MQQYRVGGFGVLPPVVKNLLIINALFFLADYSLGTSFRIDLKDILGLHFPGSEKFAVYQFVTYMFMHGDFTHLFGNMFALWMFGQTLEKVWGTKKFLIFYFVTGIGAALVHYGVMYIELQPVLSTVQSVVDEPTIEGVIAFTNSDALRMSSIEIHKNYTVFVNEFNNLVYTEPRMALQLAVDYLNTYKVDLLNAQNVVGASGSIFGLLLAFGMLFPNVQIYVYFLLPIRAKYFVILYGVAELFMGMSGAQSNVAHFAHLGGMLFGFFLIRYWKRKSFY